MTPLPVIADVYRVALNWSNDTPGQSAENVMHFHAVGSSAAAVGAILDASVQGDMWKPVCSTSGIDSLSITPLDGSSATVLFTTESSLWTGETAGDWSPASAPVVAFATGLRGRSYRGRLFLPFCAEGAISDGSLTGTLAADVVDAWISFQGYLSETPVTHVVASYKHATAAPVTSYTVASAIGTQRRRQTRVRYP